MNVRQQLYKKHRLSGMNAYRSAIKAGYAHNTAIAAYKNIEKRINFDDLLIKHGLDDDTIVKVLGDGLNAVKTVNKGHDKETKKMITEDKPDHAIRHRYLETMLKLKGELQEIVSQKSTQVVIIRETRIENGDQGSEGRLSGSISIKREEVSRL